VNHLRRSRVVPWIAPQRFRHGISGRGTLWFEDVAVNIGRHANGRVTKNVGDHFDGDALRQHDRCGRMPELMGVPSAESGTFADADEVSVDVARVERSADLGGEDKTRIRPRLPHRQPILRLTGSMRLQRLHNRPRDVERASALRRLDLTEHERASLALECVPDHQNATVERHIRPGKAERLSPP